MAEPIISNVTLDHTKISAISGQNIAHVSFQFDVPVMEYAVRVNGTDQTTGIFAGSGSKDVLNLKTFNALTTIGSKVSDVGVLLVSQLDVLTVISVCHRMTVADIKQFSANSTIIDQVDNTELYAEGNNRINIYGKSLDGTWSTYNQT